MRRQIIVAWRKDFPPSYRAAILVGALVKIRRYAGWLGVVRALADIIRVGWRRAGLVAWIV